MKNEEKNRKQQLTSLPISINILKVALMVAGVYYLGVKFLFAILYGGQSVRYSVCSSLLLKSSFGE